LDRRDLDLQVAMSKSIGHASRDLNHSRTNRVPNSCNGPSAIHSSCVQSCSPALNWSRCISRTAATTGSGGDGYLAHGCERPATSGDCCRKPRRSRNPASVSPRAPSSPGRAGLGHPRQVMRGKAREPGRVLGQLREGLHDLPAGARRGRGGRGGSSASRAKTLHPLDLPLLPHPRRDPS
jgi:hypothetical protein